MYKVYILLCQNLSFYTGYTFCLKQRIKQHNIGEVKATRKIRPLKLVHHESFSTKQEAMVRERQIKGWSRAKKEALINGDVEKIKLLSKSKST